MPKIFGDTSGYCLSSPVSGLVLNLVCQTAHAKAHSSGRAFEQFKEAINDEDFEGLLKDAQADPKGVAAQDLLKKVLPFLSISNSIGLTEGKGGRSSGPKTKTWSRVGEGDDNVAFGDRRHRRPGFGRLCRLWHRVNRGCSCLGCGGGSWRLFLPLLRRQNCVGEGVGIRGWMPPRQLVAVVPRWSRGVVGEGVGEG